MNELLQRAKHTEGISIIEVVLAPPDELPERIFEVIKHRECGFESTYGFASGSDLEESAQLCANGYEEPWSRFGRGPEDFENEILKEIAASLRQIVGPLRTATREYPQDWVQALGFLERLGLEKWRFVALSEVPLYREYSDPDSATNETIKIRRRFTDDDVKAVATMSKIESVEAAIGKMSFEVREGRQVLVQLHPAKNGKASGVTAIQTLFVDLDEINPISLALAPTMVVESSRGRYQAYYRLAETIDPDEGLRLNKALCERLGGDMGCLVIAGKGLKVAVPGLPRKRRGKPISTPSVIDWDGPEYLAEDIRAFCGHVPDAASALSAGPSLLQPGERLTERELFTAWKQAEATVRGARHGSRLARLERAFRHLLRYKSYGLNRGSVRHLRDVAIALWPECETTIVDTMKRLEKGTYLPLVPLERLNAQRLADWAAGVFDACDRVVFAEAILTRPESVTEQQAQTALRKHSTALGWRVSRRRHHGATSRVAERPS